jgi:hypothetical protein
MLVLAQVIVDRPRFLLVGELSFGLDILHSAYLAA